MDHSDRSRLEIALDAAEHTRPGRLPRALPLGHMASANHLANILSEGRLEPGYCPTMRKRTLYFFYGGLSYRSVATPTQEETAYPVGFLFNPQVLDDKDVHYPFDTGAMAHGLYGDLPTGFRSYKKAFRVARSGVRSATEPTHCPRLIVKHLFANNHNYLAGKPTGEAVGKPEPIPSLFRFMFAGPDESDHRRACVETQKHSSVNLRNDLLWVGYPDLFESDIQTFLRVNEFPVPVRTWAYPSYRRYRPSEICAMLQGRASQILDPYLAD